jgi:hypothetical protein
MTDAAMCPGKLGMRGPVARTILSSNVSNGRLDTMAYKDDRMKLPRFLQAALAEQSEGGRASRDQVPSLWSRVALDLPGGICVAG